MTDAAAIVEPYDPRWASWFLQVHALLGRTLAGHFSAIEHVGGTAVPGLASRPVIDVLVVAREGQVQRIVSYLEPLGYRQVSSGSGVGLQLEGDLAASLPAHRVFIHDGVTEDVRRARALRDYLVSKPEEARRLGDAKLALAEGGSVEDYVSGKQQLLDAVLRRAIAAETAP